VALALDVRGADLLCARLQFLGWYNPLKHETQLDGPAIQAWLAKGAQPSVSVENLLKKAMIVQQVGPKKEYKQLSTKDAATAKAAKAAELKKAATARADRLKAKAAAAKEAAKAKAEAAKAEAAAA
jgi:ribosomal protein S16